MAHTLKLIDSIEGTLDLAATAAAGYHLLSYPFATQPNIEERKSSSQWVDGELPYYDRRMNITETITIDVVGTSVDDLWAKVRALQRALENARDYFMSPGIRTCTYLQWAPQGCTNSGYSAVISGTVVLPNMSGTIDDHESEAQHIAFTIEGVKLEIEREPFWRALAPVPSTTITNWARLELSAAAQSIYTNHAITAVTGDMPALARLEIIYGNANLKTAYVSLASETRAGANRGAKHLYLRLAGAGGLGTDTTADADATCLGYPDGTGAGLKRITCTFATDITSVMRVVYAAGGAGQALKLRGAYRCLLRAKTTAAGLAVVNLTWSTDGGSGVFSTATPTTLPAVNVGLAASASDWQFYDLGIIDTESAKSSLYASATVDYGIKEVKVYASGAASIDLYMDGIVLMPIGEYFMKINGSLTLDATHRYAYDNVSPMPSGHTHYETTNLTSPNGVNGAGSLLIPPGNSMLSIVHAEGEITTDFDVSLYVCERYTAPRGAG